jgi:hypothetical protein
MKKPKTVSKVKLFRELTLLEEHLLNIKSKLELDEPFEIAPVLKQLHSAYDVILIYEIQHKTTALDPPTKNTLQPSINSHFQSIIKEPEIFRLLFNQRSEDLKTVLIELEHCGSPEEAQQYLDSLYKLYNWNTHQTVYLKFKNYVEQHFEF